MIAVAYLVKFRRRLKRDGLWSTLKGCLQLFRRQVFLIYYRSTGSKCLRNIPVPVFCGIDRFLAARGSDELLPDEFYIEQKPKVWECFFVLEKARPVGVLWALAGRRASRFIDLGPCDAELSSLYVLPGSRNRGLAKALYAAASQALLSCGFSHVFAVIAEGNIASQKAAEAVGFREIARLRRPMLFGFKFRPKQCNASGFNDRR